MARSPAPRTIVDLRMVTEPGSERASCLDHGARPECSPSFARDTTARPAVLRAIALRRDTIARRRAEAPVLPRQCTRRRSPIRAGTRSRRSARTSGRAWAVSPGADHMAIAKPSASPPRSRSRRRSPPTRGGRSRPAGPSTAEANVPARAGELAQYAADGVPRARSHLTAARTKERFFASQVTARGPIVAPWNTPTVPILQQPDPRKLRKCSEFLDSGEWAIQDSNLGPLPYQENLLSPPVPSIRT